MVPVPGHHIMELGSQLGQAYEKKNNHTSITGNEIQTLFHRSHGGNEIQTLFHRSHGKQ
jgi:hypothetical protein